MPLAPRRDRPLIARHLVLQDVGGPGQGKLKAARVLVIGAGGLGAPLIQYLAAAGVGTIGIVDDDAGGSRQPPAPGDPRHAGHRPPQGGERGGRGGRASTRTWRSSPTARGSRPRTPARWSQPSTSSPTARTISPRAMRSRTPASTRSAPLVTGRARPVRRHADHDPRPRDRARRDAQPHLSLPLSRCSAARRDPHVRRGGRSRRTRGRDGLDDGDGGRARDPVGFGEGLVGRLLMVDARAMRFETLRYRWDHGNPLSGTPTLADRSAREENERIP